MSKVPWSGATSTDEVARRAAGRRLYNARRSEEREWRRLDVLAYLQERGWYHGLQAKIARELGVSEATISRDIASILYTNQWCPTCGTLHSRSRWREQVRRGKARWTRDGTVGAVPGPG